MDHRKRRNLIVIAIAALCVLAAGLGLVRSQRPVDATATRAFPEPMAAGDVLNSGITVTLDGLAGEQCIALAKSLAGWPDLTAAQQNEVARQIERIAENADADPKVIRKIFWLAGDRSLTRDNVHRELREIVVDYAAVSVTLEELAATDTTPKQYVARARAALDAGNLSLGDEQLRRAVQYEIDRAHARQRERADSPDAANRFLARAARLHEALGELDLIRSRYRAAAQQFAEAASQTGFAPLSSSRYQLRQAEALYSQAEHDRSELALRQSIPLFQTSLAELGATFQDVNNWAIAQYHFGAALVALAKKGEGTGLREAVTALRSALAEKARPLGKPDRIAAQNALGTAATMLGARTPVADKSGSVAEDDGAAALRVGIAAHQAALDMIDQDQDRLAWLRTKALVGAALARYGARLAKAKLASDDAKAILRQALVSLDASAGDELLRADPPAWADAQNSRGIALETLGLMEQQDSDFVRAKAAFSAALTAPGANTASASTLAEFRDNLSRVTRTLQFREQQRDAVNAR